MAGDPWLLATATEQRPAVMSNQQWNSFLSEEEEENETQTVSLRGAAFLLGLFRFMLRKQQKCRKNHNCSSLGKESLP